MGDGKTNADFRALLAPRKTVAPQHAAGKGKPRAPYTGRPGAKGGEAEAAVPAAAPVRDRAAERRLGANPDYAETAIPSGITLDESKFLGGDLEHTHAVKGLDYALLQAAYASPSQSCCTAPMPLSLTPSPTSQSREACRECR